MMNTFPCTGCGCCCKRISYFVDKIDLLPKKYRKKLKFPYKHNNGVCEKLMEDNKCAIYENRPLICNIDKFIEEFKLNKEEFYEINIKYCNEFMNEDNIPNNFRII